MLEIHPTCFRVKLEKTLQDEIGSESFSQWLSEAQQAFGIAKKEHAVAILEYVVDKAVSSGKTSISLDSIVENIVALRNQP